MTAVVIIVTLIGMIVLPAHGPPPAATLPMLALQVLLCLPWTKAFRVRWGKWALPVQAALFALGGPAGYLSGTVLLVVPGVLRWVLVAGVLAAAGALNADDVYTCANATGNALTHGLFILAVTRLSDLRAELVATREELAVRSVAGERARVSRDLEEALGAALSRIIRMAAEGVAEPITRIALDARARARAAAPPPSDRPPPPSPDELTPRLAMPLMITLHLWYPVIALIYLVHVGVRPGPLVLSAVLLVLVVGLQFHHALPRPPGPPPYAAWTLPAQAVLAWLPLLATDRPYPQLAWFAAGSILIVLAGRPVAWAAVAVYLLSAPAVLLARGGDAGEALRWMFDGVTTAMMFYGLALFTHLAYRVGEARLSLAELAVAQERRRIARDVHDLLGSGLWGILVKTNLALNEPARADAELADVAGIARRTLGDLRAIPDDRTPDLSPAAELESARDLLASSGVRARVTWEPGPLQRPVENLLATVLREAVTNVLRHSRARTCAIEATRAGDVVRLRIANDGAPIRRDAEPGQGVANLTARAAALGGRLSAGPGGDGFELLMLQPAAPPGPTP